MQGFIWAEGYRTPLSLRETQKAIKFVKDTFQGELAPLRLRGESSFPSSAISPDCDSKSPSFRMGFCFAYCITAACRCKRRYHRRHTGYGH